MLQQLRSFFTSRATFAAARSHLGNMVESATAERAAELRHNYDSIADQVKQAAAKRGSGPTVRGLALVLRATCEQT